MTWVDSLLPSEQQWQNFRGSLITMKDNISEKVEIGELRY